MYGHHPVQHTSGGVIDSTNTERLRRPLHDRSSFAAVPLTAPLCLGPARSVPGAREDSTVTWSVPCPHPIRPYRCGITSTRLSDRRNEQLFALLDLLLVVRTPSAVVHRRHRPTRGRVQRGPESPRRATLRRTGYATRALTAHAESRDQASPAPSTSIGRRTQQYRRSTPEEPAPPMSHRETLRTTPGADLLRSRPEREALTMLIPDSNTRWRAEFYRRSRPSPWRPRPTPLSSATRVRGRRTDEFPGRGPMGIGDRRAPGPCSGSPLTC